MHPGYPNWNENRTEHRGCFDVFILCPIWHRKLEHCYYTAIVLFVNKLPVCLYVKNERWYIDMLFKLSDSRFTHCKAMLFAIELSQRNAYSLDFR